MFFKYDKTKENVAIEYAFLIFVYFKTEIYFLF